MNPDAKLLEKLAIRWLAASSEERKSIAIECPVLAREVSDAAEGWLSGNIRVAPVKLDKPSSN